MKVPSLRLVIPLVVFSMMAACAGTANTTTTATPATSGTTTASATGLFEAFDPTVFNSSTEIANNWFPLLPGIKLVYEGKTVDGDEEIPHRVEAVVTDLIKVISGVRTVVLWEQDFADGELDEAELSFFAQDDEGNVWHLGEYPEVYVDGEIVETPAWISGFEDAKAGLFMKAAPQPGTPSYSQGWGPAVEWYDRAQIFEVGQSICVPAGCYQDMVVIDEFDLAEPNFFQVKYYAPGIGNVRVGWKGPDPDQETLELIERIELTPEALAQARAAAMELETRGYELNPTAYGKTSPIETEQ